MAAYDTPVDIAVARVEPGTGPGILFTVPAMNQIDVSPSLTQASIAFNRDMGGGYSWCTSYYYSNGYPYYGDPGATWSNNRTCSVQGFTLEENHVYGLIYNLEGYTGFRDYNSVPLSPTPHMFITSGGEYSEASELYDEVWDNFDYYYPQSRFSLKGVDWDMFNTKYRPAFLNEMNSATFSAILGNILRELHDSHVYVRSPNDVYMKSRIDRDIQYNAPSPPIDTYAVSGYVSLDNGKILHGLLESGYAHIIVTSLSNWTITDIELQALFTQYQSAPGLIVDIRLNGGGDSTRANWFCSHLIDEPVYYMKIMYGDGAINWVSPLVPSTSIIYSGPVVGLIGNYTGSSAEAMTLMLRACPAVTLIGAKTCGASGNPQGFTLENGVYYTVSRSTYCDPSGIPIEDNGIVPDIEIPSDQSYNETQDYVLEQAISYLDSIIDVKVR